MIRSLVQAATSFLLAAREERQALAELHRANTRRAEVVPFAMPATTPHVEDEPAEFFACSYRAAECVFDGLTDASLITCPYHKVGEGKPCPGEPENDLRDLAVEDLGALDVPQDALLGTAGGAKLSFAQPSP